MTQDSWDCLKIRYCKVSSIVLDLYEILINECDYIVNITCFGQSRSCSFPYRNSNPTLLENQLFSWHWKGLIPNPAPQEAMWTQSWPVGAFRPLTIVQSEFRNGHTTKLGQLENLQGLFVGTVGTERPSTGRGAGRTSAKPTWKWPINRGTWKRGTEQAEILVQPCLESASGLCYMEQ